MPTIRPIAAFFAFMASSLTLMLALSPAFPPAMASHALDRRAPMVSIPVVTLPRVVISSRDSVEPGLRLAAAEAPDVAKAHPAQATATPQHRNF